MALEGDLRDFRLTDILQMVALQHKTGILTVQGEQDIIALSFLRGSVVAADALNQSVEDGLGQVLEQEHLVRPDLFSAVVAEHQAGGERLVDLLLARGALSRIQLLRALRLQTLRLLLQLLRWQEGEFKFYSGEEVSFEEGFQPIPIEELMLRALEELGPSFLGDAHGLPEPESIFEVVSPAPAYRVIGRDGDGPADDDLSLWIAASEAGLLPLLDGKTRSADLASRAGTSEPKLLFALFRLARYGLVRERAKSTARTTAGPVAAPARSAPPVSSPSLPAAVPEPPRRRESAVLLPLEPPPRPAARPMRSVSRLPQMARAAGALLTAGLLFALWLEPRRAVLPYPWQGEDRLQLEKVQRTALVLGMDRAARSHFLLEGRYPDSLEQFLSRGLLGRVPSDPSGRPWEYRPSPVGYSLTPLGPDGPIAELAVNEGIPGDFLLDPEFLAIDETSKVAPLVLLD